MNNLETRKENEVERKSKKTKEKYHKIMHELKYLTVEELHKLYLHIEPILKK